MIREDDFGDGNSLNVNGGYILGGYKFSDEFQGIARYEFFTPNTDLDDNELTVITIGANYYFVGNTRVSVNYEIRDDKLNPDFGNLLTVQMQVML
jgi:predicted porin